MAFVKLNSSRSINKQVSHLPGVKVAVSEVTTEIFARSSTILGAHRNTGQSEIKMEMGRVDGHVWLEDPAALSIEYGHWVYNRGPRPIYVPGIYPITAGSGLMG